MIQQLALVAGGAAIAMLFVNLYEGNFAKAFKCKPKTPTPPPLDPCTITHQFVTIDAQVFKNAEGGSATLKLSVCNGCGGHIVVVMPGAWSIETLLLKEAKPVGEVAELKRMLG